jgi:hypothetical protein
VGFWDEFGHDPRAPENAHLRASDRDREVVTALLGTAYADGRLDRAEFDERAGQVTASRTLADLPPIVADLVAIAEPSGPATLRPAELRAEAERRYERERRQALFSFATPTLICWVIWAWVLLAGNGTPFPWPVFVTIGTGAHLFRLVTDREDQVRAIQRRLEKRQARELRRGTHDEPDAIQPPHRRGRPH